ncbi:MAG: AAA-like domain-containing protein, partial [Anaerolineae bacterium]
MSNITNPFSYGKPIDEPARFIGRRREIEQIYSRLLSAFESSSIIGERRVGKTSLLKILADPVIQARYNLDPQKYTFVYQDFLFLDENTTPSRFWQRVLRNMRRGMSAHPQVVSEIELALKSDSIDNYTLDDLFTLIDDEELYIVLLLDEFEQVTRNKNFDNDFFGGLRALAIHHNLALITSSRQDLVKLTHSEQLRSSPFFNIFATINLRNFSEQDATDLIDLYLRDSGVRFLLSELNVIFAVAGYNPFFLQMACHHLFAAYQQGLDDVTRRRYLLEETRREGLAIFQDFWQSSSASQQILLVVLALRELERRAGKQLDSTQLALSEDTVADLEKFYRRASQSIGDLELRGLVIKNPDTSGYHLFSTEFCEWLADEIVGDTTDLRAWRDWQKDETLVGTLPVKLQDLLAQVVQGLNPNYRGILGNWLLEPGTASAALSLIQTFVTR